MSQVEVDKAKGMGDGLPDPPGDHSLDGDPSKAIYCLAAGCGTFCATSRDYEKHWAALHMPTIRKFVCPAREAAECKTTSANSYNLGRHVERKHKGQINGRRINIPVECHKSVLRVAEYLNPDFKPPGDVPPPEGLQHYYQVMGLDPVTPEFAIDKPRLRMHSEAVLRQAAQEVQVTVQNVKQEPESDEEEDEDQDEVPPAESGSVVSLLDQAIGGEPENPDDKSVVVEEVQEYVVVPTTMPDPVQPKMEEEPVASTSNFTTIQVQQISGEEAFDQQLKFWEEVIQCARKRHTAPAAPGSASDEKVARLELELKHKEEECRHLQRLVDEKDQHIVALKRIIDLSKVE